MIKQVGGEPDTFEQIAFPQAERGVGDGGIVDDEVTFAARGAVVINEFNVLFDEGFGKFFGISNRGGCKDELRLCAVEIRHPFESADDVGDMRAEDPAIGVGFVNDDEFQVREEVAPVGVMRQDSRVEHVGIGQDDAGVFTNGRAVGLRSVAIVDAAIGRVCKLIVFERSNRS